MASAGHLPPQVSTALTHRPNMVFNSMLNVSKLNIPVRTPITREDPTAALGSLEALPVELLHMVFEMLDLRSLVAITNSSTRGSQLALSLPAYRNLLEYAPEAIAALRRVGLAECHTIARLHAALLDGSCVSCERFGSFLFLPTGERCCHFCLVRNQSLWVTTPSLAQKAFGLSKSLVRTLPTMKAVPGIYSLKYEHAIRRRTKLVSVKLAKQLAISQGISMEIQRNSLEARRATGRKDSEYFMLRWLQAASALPPGPSFAFSWTEQNCPDDNFGGTASIVFPHLDERGSLESGFCCKGCHEISRLWSRGALTATEISHLIRPGRHEGMMLRELASAEWTQKTFSAHVDQCPGSKRLMQHEV